MGGRGEGLSWQVRSERQIITKATPPKLCNPAAPAAESQGLSPVSLALPPLSSGGGEEEGRPPLAFPREEYTF